MNGDGHGVKGPVADGFRNQAPSNWAGTGPPGGGDADGVGLATAGDGGAADGVASFAEDVDWPHAEPRKTNATASRAVIAGEPIQRRAVMRVRQRSEHS